MCVRYAGNPDAAKDLLQDGFIKIFTRLDEYTAVGSFEGWMRKIFINCALEKIRQDKFFFFGSGCWGGERGYDAFRVGEIDEYGVITDYLTATGGGGVRYSIYSRSRVSLTKKSE